MRAIVILIVTLCCLLVPEARAGAFGDSDPVDWMGKAPQRYPVHGIDAARY